MSFGLSKRCIGEEVRDETAIVHRNSLGCLDTRRRPDELLARQSLAMSPNNDTKPLRMYLRRRKSIAGHSARRKRHMRRSCQPGKALL